MALKEYIGLARLTQAFSLLKSKLDGKEDTPTVISYDDFMELTPEQQTSGYYLVVGGTPGAPTSSGHTIQNESGTDLTQRDTLQFKGGLKATDDSTNEKTVVDGAPTEITWAQYNALSPAEQAALEHTLVTDVPGADGTISADLLTKLWENPSPTSSFAAQNIALSSSDYDFLIITYKSEATGYSMGTIIPKGNSAVLFSGTNYRGIAYVSDTSYDARDCSAGNQYVVPTFIYGIKKTVTVTFDALARDVSTSASKCMLSDGVTSVEDTIDELKISTLGTPVNLESYVEGTSRYTCPSDGYCEIGTNVVGQTVTAYVNGVALATVYSLTDAKFSHTSFYVRKGMELSKHTSSTGHIYFIPIT